VGEVTAHRTLRAIHLCSGLFCLAFLLAYGVSAVAMAHRSWFAPGRLVRLHAHVPPHGGAIVLGVVSGGLLTLGATGFALWMKNHSQRKLGIALLLAGGGMAITLIVSMRLG
jgi:hypothetical protein